MALPQRGHQRPHYCFEGAHLLAAALSLSLSLVVSAAAVVAAAVASPALLADAPVESERSLACFLMLEASARTLSSSPAQGKLLAQYSETSEDALVISPTALLTAFAVHLVLHEEAILRFSSSVASITACWVSLSPFAFSAFACSASVLLISSLVLMVLV